MAYTPNSPAWADYPATTTPITAERLTHMENGIAGAVASTTIRDIVTLYESAYAALTNKDSSTMYCILPDPETE